MPVFCARHGERFTPDEFVALGLLGFPCQIVGGRHDRFCSGLSLGGGPSAVMLDYPYNGAVCEKTIGAGQALGSSAHQTSSAN